MNKQNQSTILFKPTIKQHQFYEAFRNNQYLEIGFGGAVSGGKSFIAWAIMILESMKHPGIRIGLARNTLADIKTNTMSSFYEVYRSLGLPESFYNYNSQAGKITFANGSVIQFYELRYLPTDPDYVRISGALLTFAVIEEAQGVSEKGKAMLQSRVGRWMNDETGIGPKLLMTFNPGINFLYQDFYLPWKNNEMPDYRKFVPAKLSDNKYQAEGYRRNLELTLNEIDKSRLLDGEWDFDGDKTRLLLYEEVLDLYNFPKTYKPKGDYYITADIAYTSDKAIIMLWKGLDIIKIIHHNPQTDGEIEDVIIKLRDEYNVNPKFIAYDSDGVGQHLKNKLKQSIPIVNNARPLNNENYDHLKSQLYFKLGEVIKEGGIKVLDNTLKSDLIQEVYEIKSQPLETLDGKLKIIRKKDVVAAIGRSPDLSDAMAYRCIFEIKAKPVSRPFGLSR